MTRDEILAMKPGRELDAIIINQIMNWPVIKNEFYIGGAIVEISDKEGAAIEFCSPSKDMNLAYKVVEKMKQTHCITIGTDTGGRYYCCFTPFGGNMVWTSHSTASLPEAICKAALLAVLGGETE